MTHHPLIAAVEAARYRTYGIFVVGDIANIGIGRVILKPGAVLSSEIVKGPTDYLADGEGEMTIRFDLRKAYIDFGDGKPLCLYDYRPESSSLAQEIADMCGSKGHAGTT